MWISLLINVELQVKFPILFTIFIEKQPVLVYNKCRLGQFAYPHTRPEYPHKEVEAHTLHIKIRRQGYVRHTENKMERHLTLYKRRT